MLFESSSQVKENAMDGPRHMHSFLDKKLLAPYWTQGSLLQLQEPPTTCPSSQPHQSSPQFKIQCNITIIQCMTSSTKWFLSFSSPHQTHYASPLLLKHATCPTHLLLLDLSPRKYLMISTNHEAPHYAIFSSLLLLPPLRYKYIPQQTILKLPQLIIFPSSQ